MFETVLKRVYRTLDRRHRQSIEFPSSVPHPSLYSLHAYRNVALKDKVSRLPRRLKVARGWSDEFANPLRIIALRFPEGFTVTREYARRLKICQRVYLTLALRQ